MDTSVPGPRRPRRDGREFAFAPALILLTGLASAPLARAQIIPSSLKTNDDQGASTPLESVHSRIVRGRVARSDERHYLSGVAFGAALAIVAGRTVTVGSGHRLMLTPMATADDGSVAFTWIGKK